MPRTLVSAWHGTYLIDGTEVVRQELSPRSPAELAARARQRAAGHRTPEEERLLATRGDQPWVTRDRRLVGPGISLDPKAPGVAPEADSPALVREFLLLAAERALADAWDPSVHVEEAVRAARDLDRARNLIGERLASWAGRDRADVGSADPDGAARALLDDPSSTSLGPSEPALAEARRQLAELYRSIGATRASLEAAVAAAVPLRTPNLEALLGPELAGLLLAQAGGLDRLARLPASTIQVLGAERAFFDHLRGRGPPPRHGLLFLHPKVQSAPRGDRGKLARALAGKAAIAARRDRSGSPVAPELRAAFERRESELTRRRSSRGKPAGSPLPLDRAAGDRHG